MRVSVHRGDPGYNPDLMGKCTVLLDGVDVTSVCYTADEEGGMAYCYKLNMSGKKYIDPDTDLIATIDMQGHVEIIIDKDEG